MWIKLFFVALLAAVAPLSAGIAADGGEARLIVALGDSLTAGYNLPPGESFPAQLEAALRARGLNVSVANAGVSGDTSSGGRARLDWALSSVAGKPDLVIVEFGGNDVLRGIEPSITRANIDAILEDLGERDIPVLLAGMQAPPNMGRDYAEEFNALYPALAQKHDVPFYPFFLDGVVFDPDLKLGDGIHPNGRGVGVMVERILPSVLDALGGS